MGTQQLILNKSRELFFRRGIRSVSMDEIAIQLGISKKTVYQFFDTKADLVKKAVENHIEEDKTRVTEIHAQAENAVDEMIRIFEYVSTTHRDFNPVSVYDLQRSYPQAWNVYVNYRENFINHLIRENLHNGIKQEMYRKDMNVEIVTRLYTSGLDNLMDETRFPLLEFGLIPLYKEFINYHLHAVLSSKGMEYLQKRNYA